MKKFVFLLPLLVVGCVSNNGVKPKLDIEYSQSANTAKVIVTQSINSSDKSMERLANQGSLGIGSYLNCPSGKMKKSWLNNGKPKVSETNPNAKVLILQVECV